jgi:NADH-quinone oxidoreductase subunit L
MFRLWYLTFMGKPRNPEVHPHESRWSMTGPLVILAVLSACGGWIGSGRFGEFLAPAVGTKTAEAGSESLELILSVVAVLVAAVGWYIADQLYRAKPERAATLATSFSGPYSLLVHKYYVDEIYNFFVVKPVLALSRFFLEWVVDWAILGGLALLLGGMAQLGGAILQRWQSGNLRSYAAWLAMGAAALLLFVLMPWTSLLAEFGIHVGMVGH